MLDSHYTWTTYTGFAASIGLWTTVLLWLITRCVWVSVFILGVFLGMHLLRNLVLSDEVRRLQARVADLQLEMSQMMRRRDDYANAGFPHVRACCSLSGLVDPSLPLLVTRSPPPLRAFFASPARCRKRHV